MNRVHFGGDYNPEQWPEEVWAEDVAADAGGRGHLVTVGVFSWALAGARAGAVGLRLAGPRSWTCCTRHGIAVDLATPTASPPAWLAATHPETLPVDEDGTACRTAAASTSARARPSTGSGRCDRPTAGRAVRRPSRAGACGTSATSTAATTRPATATSRPRRSAAGCGTGTATWTRSTTPGAPRSGASATATGPRSCRPAPRPDMRNPAQQLDWRRFSSDALLRLLPSRARHPAAS